MTFVEFWGVERVTQFIGYLSVGFYLHYKTFTIKTIVNYLFPHTLSGIVQMNGFILFFNL